MIKYCISFLLLFLSSITRAQDIHFSQFNHSPLNANPANTNLFFGDLRLVGNYKNQWFSVPVNYNTAALSAEIRYFEDKKAIVLLGGGFQFYFDRAGDSKFTSYNVAYNQSIGFQFGKKKNNMINFALQFGGLFRTFAYDKLRFDEQWNGDIYNPNIPNSELFSNQLKSNFDLGTGIAYRWAFNRRNYFQLGVGVFHLNQPKESWFNQPEVKLNPRITSHFRGQAQVHSQVDLVVDFLYQRQDSKQEIAYGLYPKIYVYRTGKTIIAVNFGAYHRWNDAAWILAGFDYNEWSINFNYDINISKFLPATRSNGGFEMSVIYTLEKVKKFDKSFKYCPAFL